MFLERDQETKLNGDEGPAVQWAMETLIDLGDRSRSKLLVPVSSVHIHDWCGKDNHAAWEALESLHAGSAVPSTANPVTAACSLIHQRTLESLNPCRVYSFTCAPYLSGNHPGRGAIVAWGGRAASAFANSILGSRCDRETFESAVASAIVGLTPERGLHLEANRQPTVSVILPPVDKMDYAAVGRAISDRCRGEIPLLCGAHPTFDEAKRLALAVNSQGAIPLFRIQRNRAPPTSLEVLELDRSDVVSDDQSMPDLVILGCPHLSEQDINRWAKKLAGRPRSSTEAWFFTSRLCLDKCPIFGAVLRSRGKVFADACPISLVSELKGRVIACDSPSLMECLSKEGISAFHASDQALLDYLVQ